MSSVPLTRVSIANHRVFFETYALATVPIIVTNLFEGAPIRNVHTLSDAKAAFGHARLVVGPVYTAGSTPDSRPTQIMSFNDYWSTVERDPKVNLLCTEEEIPARVMELMSLPEVCRLPESGTAEILSLPKRYGDHDLHLNAFVARRGSKAPLHYDTDHRHVLLYQIFGDKDVVIFGPESGPHLEPRFDPAFSGVSMESLTQQARQELLEVANGHYGTLSPGEAVLIPPLAWHYFDYVDDGMSVNIRFGRNRFGRFLCSDNFHRDYFVQNVAAKFIDERRAARDHEQALNQIVAEYLRPTASRGEKAKTMRSLFRRLLGELCAPLRPQDFCPDEFEEQEMGKIAAAVTASACYTPREMLALSRPTGAISPQQIRHLNERAAHVGYTQTVFDKVLWNRVGKAQLENLTKAEAAQIMTYLRSPCAQW